MTQQGKNNPAYIHGMRNHRLYAIYYGIKRRCNVKIYSGYKNYGGRGIKCEWKSFIDFYRDMGLSHKKNLSIDRIDNNGNYCKNNCRWANRKEQNTNTRRTITITHNGKSISLKDWSRKLGVKYETLRSRYKVNKNPVVLFRKNLYQKIK